MAERPDRVSIPGILSEHAGRLRALERSRPGFVPPKGDDFIELWDEGVPQGLVRALDFVGSGVQALTTGDERGIVNISGGGAGGWDAIVDSAAVASDPEARLFQGIGEALTYLVNTALLTSCVIAVRPGVYNETANWDMPVQTRLFGLRGTGPILGIASTDSFAWDWNGFRPSGAAATASLMMENCRDFVPGSQASAGGIQQPLSNVLFRDVYMNYSGFPTTVALCTTFFGDHCTFDIIGNGNRILSTARCVLVQCDGACRPVSSGAQVFIPVSTLSNTSLVMIGCCFSAGASGTCSWNLPQYFNIEAYYIPNRFSSGGAAITLVVPNNANGHGYIRVQEGLSTSIWNVSATNAFGRLFLYGPFSDITATGAHTALEIDGQNVSSTWDMASPAVMESNATGNAKYILRGNGIAGIIGGNPTSSGTFISFVGADDNMLIVGADGSGSTKKAYAFDATSDNNVMVFTRVASFPTLATDAGTNNRVLPEGTIPFTTNGHVIEDEAVALTQRANMNFVGAGVTAADAGGKTVVTIPGGATIDGHVIEDEGTPLTQRANLNFVGAGVTVTDGAPDTIVTIPGGSASFGSPVESQFGDVGSDGTGSGDAAESDHVHDRHDDGVLFYSKVNA